VIEAKRTYTTESLLSRNKDSAAFRTFDSLFFFFIRHIQNTINAMKEGTITSTPVTPPRFSHTLPTAVIPAAKRRTPRAKTPILDLIEVF